MPASVFNLIFLTKSCCKQESDKLTYYLPPLWCPKQTTKKKKSNICLQKVIWQGHILICLCFMSYFYVVHIMCPSGFALLWSLSTCCCQLCSSILGLPLLGDAPCSQSALESRHYSNCFLLRITFLCCSNLKKNNLLQIHSDVCDTTYRNHSPLKNKYACFSLALINWPFAN